MSLIVASACPVGNGAGFLTVTAVRLGAWLSGATHGPDKQGCGGSLRSSPCASWTRCSQGALSRRLASK
eukprot:scaffold32420_cov68-Phaeocystis_antarctica.AAC.2